MIFCPKHLIQKEGSFVFSGNVTANAHPCMNKDVICSFFRGFSFHLAELQIQSCEALRFSIGCAEALPLDGYAYSINVTPTGVCIAADTEKDLLQGYMTLLDRIQCIDSGDVSVLKIDCAEIWDRPILDTRIVHFCILPETKLWELHRFLRFAAALRFTHIILEFWGMLRYDCMKELSWRFF